MGLTPPLFATKKENHRSMLLWIVMGLALAALAAACVLILLVQGLFRREVFHGLSPTMFGAVVASSTAPVDLQLRPVGPLDTIELLPGDRVLLRHQTTAAENGLWVVPGPQADWTRAPDCAADGDLVEGRTVFVSRGQRYQNQTFVLRLLHPRTPQLGVSDVLFVPWVQHLFGRRHLPDAQALQVDAHGLATWDQPEKVTEQLLRLLRTQGYMTRASFEVYQTGEAHQFIIPSVLHVLYGFWEADAEPPGVTAWQHPNEGLTVRAWNPERGLEFLRSEAPEWLDVFQTLPRPVMRVDLLRYLLLYRYGGLVVDLDCEPHPEAGSWTAWLQQRRRPRVVLFTENHISPHEAEAVSAYPIRTRTHQPLRAGPRVATFAVASTVHHPFWHVVLQRLRDRVTIAGCGEHDHDVYFATGSELLTDVFATHGADFTDVLLVSEADTRACLLHHQAAAWRQPFVAAGNPRERPREKKAEQRSCGPSSST